MTESPDSIFHHNFASKRKGEVGDALEVKQEVVNELANEETPDNIVTLGLDDQTIERLNRASELKAQEKKAHDQLFAEMIGSLGFGSFFENTNMYIASTEKLRIMRMFLESLNIITINETELLRDDLTAKMSLGELCTAVLNSSESDWQQHPAYYRSLSKRFSKDNLSRLIQECASRKGNIQSE